MSGRHANNTTKNRNNNYNTDSTNSSSTTVNNPSASPTPSRPPISSIWSSSARPPLTTSNSSSLVDRSPRSLLPAGSTPTTTSGAIPRPASSTGVPTLASNARDSLLSNAAAAAAAATAAARPRTMYQAVTWKESLDAFNKRLRRGSMSLDAMSAEDQQIQSPPLNSSSSSAFGQQQQKPLPSAVFNNGANSNHISNVNEQTPLLAVNKTSGAIGSSSSHQQQQPFQGDGNITNNSNNNINSYNHNHNINTPATTTPTTGTFSSGNTSQLRYRPLNDTIGSKSSHTHNSYNSTPPPPPARQSTMAIQSSKMGTFSGVFIPCVLSIWGIILFLRFGFIIAQAGVIGTLGMFVVGYLINLLTTFSLSAVSTNGTVRGGGPYYLISRSLGPEFGGSIGLIFFVGTVMSGGMNVLGFVEPLIANFGESTGSVVRVLPEGSLWEFLYGTILLVSCTLVCLVGSKLFSRASLVLATIILISTLSIFVSFAFVSPFTVPERNIEYTGFSLETLSDNLWPAFTVTDGEDGKLQNFQSVFGVLFPACIGILAGASMSGDLKDPSKSIPSGTLWAVGGTFCTYTVIVILMGGSVVRETMYTDMNVLQDIALSPLYIASGALAASVFATLGSVIGAAKILQAIARDNLLPALSMFGQGTPLTDEPTLAVLLTYVLCQLCLFLTDINSVAAFVTLTSLLTFLIINLACFLLKIGSAPNFRPSFRFFHWWTAFAGMILCGLVMGFVDLGQSMLSGLSVAGLFLWIHYWSPPKRWGDVTQSLIYHQVRKYLLRLDSRKEHVKFWRPQILLLVHNPRSEYHLIQFCNHLKKGALYVLGHIILGDFRDVLNEYRRQQGAWLKFVDVLEIKAFVNLGIADSVRLGARNLLVSTGLGGMRPNIVVMGSFNLERYLSTKQLDEQQQKLAEANTTIAAQGGGGLTSPSILPQQLSGSSISRNGSKGSPMMLNSSSGGQQFHIATSSSPQTRNHQHQQLQQQLQEGSGITAGSGTFSPAIGAAAAGAVSATPTMGPISVGSVRRGSVPLTSLKVPWSLPTDGIRAEAPIPVTDYVSIIEDVLALNKAVAIGYGFDKLELPDDTTTPQTNNAWKLFDHVSVGNNGLKEKTDLKKKKKKKYIDLWPMQLSVTTKNPLNNRYSMSEGGGGAGTGGSTAAEESRTNFDTYTMVLQMGCILHMVPYWKENYLLRVMVFVEHQKDVVDETKRLLALLENLRIPAEVKVMYLDGGGISSYDYFVKGNQRQSSSLQNLYGLPFSFEEGFGPLSPIQQSSLQDFRSLSIGPKNINQVWLQEQEELLLQHQQRSRDEQLIDLDHRDSSVGSGQGGSGDGAGTFQSGNTLYFSGEVGANSSFGDTLGQRGNLKPLSSFSNRGTSSNNNSLRISTNDVQARASSQSAPKSALPHMSTPPPPPVSTSQQQQLQDGSSPLNRPTVRPQQEHRLATSVPLGGSSFMNFKIAVPLPKQYFDPGAIDSDSESDDISSDDDSFMDNPANHYRQNSGSSIHNLRRHTTMPSSTARYSTGSDPTFRTSKNVFHGRNSIEEPEDETWVAIGDDFPTSSSPESSSLVNDGGSSGGMGLGIIPAVSAVTPTSSSDGFNRRSLLAGRDHRGSHQSGSGSIQQSHGTAPLPLESSATTTATPPRPLRKLFDPTSPMDHPERMRRQSHTGGMPPSSPSSRRLSMTTSPKSPLRFSGFWDESFANGGKRTSQDGGSRPTSGISSSSKENLVGDNGGNVNTNNNNNNNKSRFSDVIDPLLSPRQEDSMNHVIGSSGITTGGLSSLLTAPFLPPNSQSHHPKTDSDVAMVHASMQGQSVAPVLLPPATASPVIPATEEETVPYQQPQVPPPPVMSSSAAPIQFDNLGSEAQLMILNELMRIHSSPATTSILFTTVPAPESGTCLSEEMSVAYVENLDNMMRGIEIPVLLIHAKSLTVTMAL